MPVQKDISMQGTLSIDQSRMLQSVTRLTAALNGKRERGARPGDQYFFLSHPRPNVGRLRRPGAVREQPCIGRIPGEVHVQVDI